MMLSINRIGREKMEVIPIRDQAKMWVLSLREKEKILIRHFQACTELNKRLIW